MRIGPSFAERLARARGDLRMGVPVVLTDAGGGAVVLAAECLSDERFRAMRDLGPTVLAVSARRAETLKARAYDGDLARIALPPEATAAWVQSVADPALDMTAPMKGPFRTERAGAAAFHRSALLLAKSASLLPAALVTEVPNAAAFAEKEGLTVLAQAEIEGALSSLSPLRDVISGRVPTHWSDHGRVHVFRPDDGGDEHYAIEIGTVDRNRPVLVRLHSACFTGDVLGSLKCDCGPQLHSALEQMGREGAGVLLYLNQEGRGIGLANKMRAYSLQDQGFDTVEANHRLGFEDDERDFRVGAAVLRSLGIGEVRLMTNNPAKVEMLEKSGIAVTERVPLRAGLNPLNEDYLGVKARKSGHLL